MSADLTNEQLQTRKEELIHLLGIVPDVEQEKMELKNVTVLQQDYNPVWLEMYSEYWDVVEELEYRATGRIIP